MEIYNTIRYIEASAGSSTGNRLQSVQAFLSLKNKSEEAKTRGDNPSSAEFPEEILSIAEDAQYQDIETSDDYSEDFYEEALKLIPSVSKEEARFFEENLHSAHHQFLNIAGTVNEELYKSTFRESKRHSIYSEYSRKDYSPSRGRLLDLQF